MSEVDHNKGNFKMRPKTKRDFQKQKYKKTFGSLQEGHGLAYLQKGAVKRKYLLEKNKAGASEDVAEESYSHLGYDREAFDELASKKVKLSKLKRAKSEYESTLKAKAQRREEKEKKEKEIEEKRKKYKEKKLYRFKKLSQKTKKGQPVMKGRMDLLLESVQSILEKEKNS